MLASLFSKYGDKMADLILSDCYCSLLTTLKTVHRYLFVARLLGVLPQSDPWGLKQKALLDNLHEDTQNEQLQGSSFKEINLIILPNLRCVFVSLCSRESVSSVLLGRAPSPC